MKSRSEDVTHLQGHHPYHLPGLPPPQGPSALALRGQVVVGLEAYLRGLRPPLPPPVVILQRVLLQMDPRPLRPLRIPRHSIEEAVNHLGYSPSL